jgi:hypothetical protein
MKTTSLAAKCVRNPQLIHVFEIEKMIASAECPCMLASVANLRFNIRFKVGVEKSKSQQSAYKSPQLDLVYLCTNERDKQTSDPRDKVFARLRGNFNTAKEDAKDSVFLFKVLGFPSRMPPIAAFLCMV